MVLKAARAVAVCSPLVTLATQAATAWTPMAAKWISSVTHPTAVPAVQLVPTTMAPWFAPAEPAHQAVLRVMTTAMET